MNILIVSQYFWPESFIINDLVIQLKEQGHNLSIYTGKPNYPDGDIFTGYQQQGVQEELYDQTIPVYRVPLRPRKKASGLNLTLNYLSFVYYGIKHAFRFSKNKQFDLILVFAISPITAAIPAIVLKWLTKAHLTIWVQDLWPESVKASGFVSNSLVISFIRTLVRGIYYFTDTLLAQSKSFVPQLARMANKSKIIYYPNSVVDIFSKEPTTAHVSSDLIKLLEDNFCIVFAGNIGKVQAVETIVEAACALKEFSEIKIVLVGSGSMSEWINQHIKDQGLTNIIVAGRYPAIAMPCIYSKAKALLVSLKKDEIFNYTVPSKIQSYLAAGKPIIASVDGEGAKVVSEASAGLISPAEDAQKLAANIIQFYRMSEQDQAKMGLSGRSYFMEHFEMGSQSKRLIEIFEQRICIPEEAN